MIIIILRENKHPANLENEGLMDRISGWIVEDDMFKARISVSRCCSKKTHEALLLFADCPLPGKYQIDEDHIMLVTA